MHERPEHPLATWLMIEERENMGCSNRHKQAAISNYQSIVLNYFDKIIISIIMLRILILFFISMKYIIFMNNIKILIF